MAELTKAEYIRIGRELVASIEGASGQPLEVKTERVANMAHAPLVFAFSTHTLRLGTVALELYERGLYLEAIPTVRAAYEFALTACWLADSREAPNAIVAEDARQRRALADAMARANSTLFREGSDEVRAVADVRQLKSVATAQARWFEQLCQSLHPGSGDAYVLYRAMSAFAHPSGSLADKYVRQSEKSAVGIFLADDPNVDDKGIWLPVLVCVMVWAARALDVMHRDGPNRSYLRSVAQQLGIAEILRLSQEALAVERRAAQDRRRAGWKGPRAKPSRR